MGKYEHSKDSIFLVSFPLPVLMIVCSVLLYIVIRHFDERYAFPGAAVVAFLISALYFANIDELLDWLNKPDKPSNKESMNELHKKYFSESDQVWNWKDHQVKRPLNAKFKEGDIFKDPNKGDIHEVIGFYLLGETLFYRTKKSFGNHESTCGVPLTIQDRMELIQGVDKDGKMHIRIRKKKLVFNFNM